MEIPAKQMTVYPVKMVEGLWAALALTRRKLLTRLSKRANKEHLDHVAHILMVGQRVPGYEEAFENLERMTDEEASEVFVCMARRSARWDRLYRSGDNPFAEVQKFLDGMVADRMAGQKMDLFHKLALKASDELEPLSQELLGRRMPFLPSGSPMPALVESTDRAPRTTPSSETANGTRDDQQIKGKINRAGCLEAKAELFVPVSL
jgi:hypothetical protein